MWGLRKIPLRFTMHFLSVKAQIKQNYFSFWNCYFPCANKIKSLIITTLDSFSKN